MGIPICRHQPKKTHNTMALKSLAALCLIAPASAFVPSTGVAHRPFLANHPSCQMSAQDERVSRRDLLSAAAGLAGLGVATPAFAKYGDSPKFGFFGDQAQSSPYDVEEYNQVRIAGKTGLYVFQDDTRVKTLKAQIDESLKRVEATSSDVKAAKWDSARADIRRQTYPLRQRMLDLNELAGPSKSKEATKLYTAAKQALYDYDGALREKNGEKALAKLEGATGALKAYISYVY